MGPNYMYPESMKRQSLHWSKRMKTKSQKENLTTGSHHERAVQTTGSRGEEENRTLYSGSREQGEVPIP